MTRRPVHTLRLRILKCGDDERTHVSNDDHIAGILNERCDCRVLHYLVRDIQSQTNLDESEGGPRADVLAARLEILVKGTDIVALAAASLLSDGVNVRAPGIFEAVPSDLCC